MKVQTQETQEHVAEEGRDAGDGGDEHGGRECLLGVAAGNPGRVEDKTVGCTVILLQRQQPTKT